MSKEKIWDRLLGVGTTLITALVVFYFSSFIKRSEVMAIVQKEVKEAVREERKQNKETYVRQDEVAVLETKLENLKEGQDEIKQDLKQLLRKM